jgi:hypothetical protein
MKSWKYLGITYHRKTYFYYIDGIDIKFKTHELICNYIEDNLWKN